MIRKIGLAMMTIAFAGPAVSAEPEPFQLKVVDVVREIPLGLRAMVWVEVSNASGVEQPVVGLELGLHAERWPRGCGHAWNDDERVPSGLVIHGPNYSVPAGWRKVVRRSFLPAAVGEYTYRVFLKMGPTGKLARHYGAPERHWTGKISTTSLTVRVVEPEGIDAEAFNAILARGSKSKTVPSPARFWAFLVQVPGSGRLLMTRYVRSVYAAQTIQRRYARLEIGAPVSSFLRYLEAEADSKRYRSTLCDSSGQPDVEHPMKLRGRPYLECSASWLELALRNHPDIWFADEMRLRLALDRYLLGDKNTCAAGLEALAAHGRPYVAAKAKDLLTAMRAKGMLPGEGK